MRGWGRCIEYEDGKEFKKKKDLFFDPLVAEIWPQASSKWFHGVSSATRPDHVKSIYRKSTSLITQTHTPPPEIR